MATRPVIRNNMFQTNNYGVLVLGRSGSGMSFMNKMELYITSLLI